MWETNEPAPAKLIIGILAADSNCLSQAMKAVLTEFGGSDLESDTWPFDFTNYYEAELGKKPLRKFVSIEKLVSPGELANIKHRSNAIEKKLAETLATKETPRLVNLDPGLIEPSKLILATTKDYAHRIYIGQQMYAEVTLIYAKGKWNARDHTYPDYKSEKYQNFLTLVRKRLLEQLKSI